MSNFKFVANYEGIGELLHSSAMKSVLLEYGNMVKGNATTRQKAIKQREYDGTTNSQGKQNYTMKTVGTEEVQRSSGASYTVEIRDKKTRAVAVVKTDSNHAYNSELKHNNLLKGLSATRKAGKT